MKRNLFLSVCLLLAGGLHAQQNADSPVFRLDGFDLSAETGFKTAPKEASDTLIPWTQPDSVVCFKAAGAYGMYVYTHDERGNTLSQEALSYLSADTWLPSQQILSTYNQWDLVDTTTAYNYNQRDGLYVPNARKISSYDKRGRAVSLLNLTWITQTEAWSKTSRYTYTYNNDNRILTSLKEEPDPFVIGGEAWMKTEKTDYGYDAQGREIRFEMYFWTGQEWFPFRAVYRTYQNDRLTRELGRIYNEMTGIYGDTYRYDYIYNEKGELTDHLVFYTDSTGKWDTSVHVAHFYDEQGRETAQSTKSFNSGSGKMENTSREYYFYNKAGIKDSVAHEVWESTGWWHTISLRYFFNEQGVLNGWIYYNLTEENRRTDKYEFEFNEYGDGTRSQCFTWQNDAWKAADRYDLEVQDRNGNVILRSNNMLLHEITVHYAMGTKTPPPPPDTTADDTTGIRPNRLLDAQVDVYPNPAAETLYVTINGDGIYDVALSNPAGTVVETFRMESGRKALDVRKYKGLHLLRVSKAGASAIRKIMIL